jgi:hypothetical protein
MYELVFSSLRRRECFETLLSRPNCHGTSSPCPLQTRFVEVTFVSKFDWPNVLLATK